MSSFILHYGCIILTFSQFSSSNGFLPHSIWLQYYPLCKKTIQQLQSFFILFTPGRNPKSLHFEKASLIMLEYILRNNLINIQSSWPEKLQNQNHMQVNSHTNIIFLQISKRLTYIQPFQYTGLTSRFATTIQINPPYPQVAALRKWYLLPQKLTTNKYICISINSHLLV